MTFHSLGLHPALLSAVEKTGYTQPTPVQAQAIPIALAGQDLMVSSSTGSGKTAAFMLPVLHRLAEQHAAHRAEQRAEHHTVGQLPHAKPQRGPREGGVRRTPRVLVLTPTRELALQVAKAADTYAHALRALRIGTLVGGVPYGRQLQQLRGGLDIVIGTPGRILDHLESHKLDLSRVQTLVLDEADRMLDMGFIDDIRAIADRTPSERQTLLFSATFAGPVARLAERMLRDPVRIEVQSHRDRHENIEQRLHYADDARHKNALLEHLLCGVEVEQAIVFTSTQRDADWLAGKLGEIGHAAAALHGGMPQGQRNRTLGALRRGDLRILVATDVAARGIDVPTISHVINYGLPMNAEDYVHRIGRTGRAGRNGLAVTLAEHRDVGMIRRIERFTSHPIPVEVIAGMEPKKTLRPAPSRPGNARKSPPPKGQVPKSSNGAFARRARSTPSSHQEAQRRRAA